MVKPLDVFLRDHVRPMLKEKGFSKKGRDFRIGATRGDVALVNFFSWRLGDCEVEFFLEVGVLPLPWVEWCEDAIGEVDDSIVSALWWKRVNSPFRPLGLWQFDLKDEERTSFFLAELSSVADHLCALVDRQKLISVVRDPATAVQELRHSREHALALLLVDDGPSPELDDILRVLESGNPADDVASWVRARLRKAATNAATTIE